MSGDTTEGGYGSVMEGKERFFVYFTHLVHHIATVFDSCLDCHTGAFHCTSILQASQTNA